MNLPSRRVVPTDERRAAQMIPLAHMSSPCHDVSHERPCSYVHQALESLDDGSEAELRIDPHRRGAQDMNRSRTTRTAFGAAVATGALALTACAGAGGGGGGGGDEVNVLMVNNPQMEDLQRLTADHFTADTGITVNYTILPENEVRARIGQEFSSQAGQYDVASLSNYEIPIYAGNGWLSPITPEEDFNQDDILTPMAESLTVDGEIYGQPFYGEGSFLMYRTDVFDEAGLTMPENPTWEEIAQLAAEIDGAESGMSGICLRGLPGWGQMIAPLTT